MQELLHAILIFWAHMTLIDPTSIHLSNSMHENLTFLFIGVGLSHLGKLSFMLASIVKVTIIYKNLTKFRQHFALVSKYTTWHRSNEFPDNQVCTRGTTWNAVNWNLIKLMKIIITFTNECNIKIPVSPNCPNGQFKTKYNG